MSKNKETFQIIYAGESAKIDDAGFFKKMPSSSAGFQRQALSKTYTCAFIRCGALHQSNAPESFIK
ncbi:MAG: hypothetical protein EB150_05505 [Nitrososphaeria archaeon]|nr:hypothetical protein [Nitrososphaeria archaeon]